jgi:hypothetical protein
MMIEKQAIALKHEILSALNDALNDPIFDPALANFIRTSCVVSGGISASVYHKEKINDIDLYCKTQEDLDKLNELRQIHAKKFNAMVKDINPNYNGVIVNGKLITSNAITLYNDLQLITMMNATQIESSFDYLHCRPYYDISENKYYISQKQLNVISNKKLIVNNQHSTPAKHREEKFLKRGWTIG